MDEISGVTDAMADPWLSIIGIGEDGLEGLTPVARRLISTAKVVYGGRRHLDLADSLIVGEARPWGVPLEKSIQEIRQMRGQRVTVLASGDPFEHGVGVTLSRQLGFDEWISVPAPGSFSLAANRLGWALQDVHRIGLNGRALERVIPLLHPGQRILALSTDETTPARVAELLTQRGFGHTELHVLEALGGQDERIRLRFASDFDLVDIHPLNLVGLEVRAAAGARMVPMVSGLPDDWFVTSDGQLTKREFRAVALSSLQPLRGQYLWDIGAGSGSIAIEWMLADPTCRATAIEQHEDRAARIAINAATLGVPGLEIALGPALERMALLQRPDAIFIGGGGSDPRLIEAAIHALGPGGRLVANGVTLETQMRLMAEQAARGGELIRIAIERLAPVGGFSVLRPALPVLQWVYVK